MSSAATPATVSSLRPHTKWGFAVLFGILGGLAVGLIVLAFVWPIATGSIKNLPIAISGPSASITAVEKAVDAQASGAIQFSSVDTRDAAVSQIKNREVYGAIILPSSRSELPEVLTASAASPSVAQFLNGIAASLQAQLVQQTAAAGAPGAAIAAIHVTVTDIVPLASTDKNGTGLVAASFPLVLGGIIGGILISLLVVGVFRRLLALLIYSIAAGTVVALILQTMFNILQRDFTINALALSLSMLATASIVVGFHALIGTPGIGVGSILTMLIGNPISGAAVPLQFFVGPWGAIGQYFVPGSASTLIRDLSYFPNYDPTRQWVTLVAWVLVGVIFSVTGHFRSRAPIALPASELESEPAHRHATMANAS